MRSRDEKNARAVDRLERLAREHRDEDLASLARWVRQQAADVLPTEMPRLESGTFGSAAPTGWFETPAAAEARRTPAGVDDPARRFGAWGSRRYAYVSELGRGGMARVLEMLDDPFNRRVAMKIVPVEGTPRAQIEQFLHEAQVTGQLEHPGVIPAYDIGIWEQAGIRYLYYTMKPVRGRPLGDLIPELHATAATDPDRARTDLRRLLRVLQSVCLVVDSAHAHGVLHRDLKPDNVMVGQYGEVYVVDWGIASVRRQRGQAIHTAVTDSGKESRAEGVVGTPKFMAPEVLAGGPATVASDTWALGAILYAILSGRPPYRGADVTEILTNTQLAEPPPPSRIARHLTVPATIEAICLAAVLRDPEARIPSPRALHDRLEAWLDGVAQFDRHTEDADRHVATGIARTSDYLVARFEHQAVAREAAALEQALATDASPEVRRRLAALEDRVHRTRLQALSAFVEAERELHKALEHDPERGAAREGLADLYFDQLKVAEAAGQQRIDDVLYYQQQVETYHDGKYQRQLRGDGTLRVTAHPAGAIVRLYRYVERDRRLVPVPWDAPEGWVPAAWHAPLTTAGGYLARDPGEAVIGQAPVFRTGVPPGSWLVWIEAEGFLPARCPVWVQRNDDARVEVHLYRRGEVPEGLVHVPGGPFLAGGDRDAPGARPRTTPVVPDFFLARFPVTCAEYLVFLDDLAATDPARARRHAPRFEDETASHWVESPEGRWSLPATTLRGVPWAPDLPVVEVTWHDAMAYADWTARRTGRPFRLPRELEWEKAARGTDGRAFPWGDRFDPQWCNMASSRAGEPRLGPIGEFPIDESVYGMRDPAGNVWEWCLDRYGEGLDLRVTCGGGWLYEPAYSRCAKRVGYHPNGPRVATGFRLALDPPRRP